MITGAPNVARGATAQPRWAIGAAARGARGARARRPLRDARLDLGSPIRVRDAGEEAAIELERSLGMAGAIAESATL
jgi:hypothetical protein